MGKLDKQVQQDFLQALKAKQPSLATLRLLKSAIQNKKIELKQDDLPDDQIIKLISSEAKKRQDSIAAFAKGGRTDLAEKEKEELTVLQTYLPEQLGEKEIKEAVAKILEANPEEKTPQAFGKVMGKVMAELKGQADGQLVQQIVKEILNS
ncbi:GatB/YqeY domain-containing protein [Patescibacteria group bacterium]|nr:GatB/YqeY domain-containing protein [Patescibacteria group bacterium]